MRTRAEEEEKISQGSIETIHQQLFTLLALLKKSMQLQTCALLWLDETGDKLKVKELCTEAAHFVEEPIPARTGVLGAILKEARPFVLGAPKPSLLPYYAGPVEVAAFMGVPVREGHTLRGVLVADRRIETPFTEMDADVLTSAAAQVVSVVQSERVFQAVERSKHEHERFYRASAELNRALTLSEVYDAAIAGARGVCDFDFAAIATYDAARQAHTIRRVVGPWAENLDGTTHRDPTAMVSMVVKNKLALPAAGEWRERDVPLFSHPMRVRDLESLLVLPLLVKDEVVGTFTVAAKRAFAFPDRPPRDAGRDREPGGDLAAERAHVPGARGAGDHRRAHRPGQPPHVPGAVLGDARARRPPQVPGVADPDRHRSLQEGQRHATATRSATRSCAAWPASWARARARSTSSRATAARSSPSCSRRPIAPARASWPSASAPTCRSSSSSRRKGTFQVHAVAGRGQLPRGRDRQGRHHRARRRVALRRQARRPQPDGLRRGPGQEQVGIEAGAQVGLRRPSSRGLTFVSFVTSGAMRPSSVGRKRISVLTSITIFDSAFRTSLLTSRRSSQLRISVAAARMMSSLDRVAAPTPADTARRTKSVMPRSLRSARFDRTDPTVRCPLR